MYSLTCAHLFSCLCTDPQKQYADAVIEVLPTQLIPSDNEGKILRVRLIMKEGVKYFSPVYLFDEGSTISWIPCGRKLTCSYPGIKFTYGPESYFGHEVYISRSLDFVLSSLLILCLMSIFFSWTIKISQLGPEKAVENPNVHDLSNTANVLDCTQHILTTWSL